MSELVNASANKTGFRRQLLATVSAIALIGFSYGAGEAKAAGDDSGRPTVWIELGGQLSRLDDSQEAYSPPLMDNRPSIFLPSQRFEKMPLHSIDETGKVSFEPDGLNLMFSGSVQYGRSSAIKHAYQQTNPGILIYATKSGVPFYPSQLHLIPRAARFAKTAARTDETHLIADFQVGKDIGIGMFGSHSESILSLGVRFAQFASVSNFALKSDPDAHVKYAYFNHEKAPFLQLYHSNAAQLNASRSFRGVGPSLSWQASAPILIRQGSDMTFDWDLNVSILFGRQHAQIEHHATGEYHSAHLGGTRVVVYQPTPAHYSRSRTTIIPNVGGSAGGTWRIQNVKVSAGYRADLFWGAMDGGIDTRKNENVGFYGPFASVSIGLGG